MDPYNTYIILLREQNTSHLPPQTKTFLQESMGTTFSNWIYFYKLLNQDSKYSKNLICLVTCLILLIWEPSLRLLWKLIENRLYIFVMGKAYWWRLFVWFINEQLIMVTSQLSSWILNLLQIFNIRTVK